MSTPEELIAAALAHHRQGRLREAELLYRQVLSRQPNHPDALHLLGVLAHQTLHDEQAVQLIAHAITVRGNVAAFHNNLGEAYRGLGRFDQAIAAYQQAIRLAPDFAEAHNNLGTVHQNKGRLDEAIACFDRAIALQPDYANAHCNRAWAWLAQGDFARGFAEFEWRHKRPGAPHMSLPQSAWDGSPLDGRRLLVYAEGGLGDTLQFIRYLPWLQAMGADVAAQVQPALVELLRQSGIGPVVPLGTPPDRFDVHASLISLPLLVGTTLDTIPAACPYLAADENHVEQWRQRLRHAAGRRVGICWQGSTINPANPVRSVPLSAFEPLARAHGVRLISLQKNEGLDQLEALAGRFEVLDLRPDYDVEQGAFLNAAAIMRNLDLVITVDTAIAHLAGALAVPVWVVLPEAADWRWLQHRSDSPWYPTIRLFRQSTRGDWSAVMRQVADALAGGELNKTSPSGRSPEPPAAE